MRNKKLINTLVLFGVCASLFSLASCQGIKGEQGDPGTPGVDGKPGQDGEDGKDGNTWLTGEGSPLSSLGKNGDLYLDTSTNDYYIKKDGSWVKTGNLQGEDGEDGKPGENGKPGQDGQNGSNGSQGPQGATAWSNTILPSENGYVTVDKGSAVIGELITFTFVPLSTTEHTYELTYLKLNNEVIDVSTISDNKYTTEMVANGFVVAAKFGLVSTETSVDGVTNALNSANPGDVVVLDAPSDSTEPFTLSNDLNVKEGVTLRIQNELVPSLESSTAKIEVQSNAKVEISSQVSVPIEIGDVNENSNSGDGAQITINKDSSINDLVINGDNVTIKGTNNNASSSVQSFSSQTNEENNNVNGNIFVEGNNVSIDGIKSDSLLKVGRTKVVENFTLTNSYLKASKTNVKSDGTAVEKPDNEHAYYSLGVKGNLKISDSVIIGSSNVYNLFEQPYSISYPLESVEIIGNTFDLNGITHNALNFYSLKDGSKVDIYGNTFNNIDMSVSGVARFTNLDINEISKESKIINFKENYFEKIGTSGSDIWDSIILFQENEGTENVSSIEEYHLIFNDNYIKNQEASNYTKISETSLVYKEACLYMKDVFSTCYGSHVPGLTINNNKINYSPAFSGGNGTVQNPYLIENSDQLESLSYFDLKGETVYFKLVSKEYVIEKQIHLQKEGKLVLDLNGAKITPYNVNGTTNRANDVNRYVIELTNDNLELVINDSTATNDNKKGNGIINGGRGCISVNKGSLEVNAGTFTDISKINGNIILTGENTNLTINYMEAYATNCTVNTNGNLTINGGKFYNISSNKFIYNDKAAYPYTIIASDKSNIDNIEVIGIQGGLAVNGADGTVLGDNIYSETNYVKALQKYKEGITYAYGNLDVLDSFFTAYEETLKNNANSVHYYALYIAGEESSVKVSVKGGTYVSTYGTDNSLGIAVLVGNSNDGGVGAEAWLTIEGGTFIGKNSSIVVDGGNSQNNYGKGNLSILGGKFNKSVSHLLTEGYQQSAETEEISVDGTTYKVYVVSAK